MAMYNEFADHNSAYNDLLELVLSSALPEQNSDLEEHIQATIFKEHSLKLETNLSNALLLLSDIDSNISIPRKVVIHTLLLCGEHSKNEDWTNSQNITYAEELVNEVLKRCNFQSMCSLLVQFSANPFLHELRPKLLKSSWKNHPAAVMCFMWILFKLECPHLGEYLNNVLPTCLLLADDHTYSNKVLSLQCLQHIALNVSRTDLIQYGRGSVIYNAVEHMIYLREPEIIKSLADCLVALLRKTEHDCVTSTLLWSHFDDVLNIWLPSMEMEQKILLREAYINSLQGLLQAMGLASTRWSNKLLAIFSEYSEQDHTRDSTLANLLTFIGSTWPRISSNFNPIVVILMKVLISINKKDVAGIPEETSLKLVKQCFKCLQKLCNKQYSTFLEEIERNDDMNSWYFILSSDNES